MKKLITLLGVVTCSYLPSLAQSNLVTPVKEYTLNEKNEYIGTVQKATFEYFWDFAHPVSGMAAERSATPNIVTSGGTGFGIMSIVTGVHRGWITRQEGVKHIAKIANFLGKAERFHGAWSHWLDGRNGKMIPFGEKDNGGDLVETAYLVNGLLIARTYFNGNTAEEKALRQSITQLWETVEWDWYASRGDNHLYWHWSPKYNWDMNMPIRGYNECLITYVLALSSPTHAIKPEVYQNTWKKSDFYENGKSYLGYKLSVGFPYGGPLFFAHYSYLSLDPRLMQDEKTNYWQHNLAQTLINYKHCVEEAPKNFGYSPENWGLTASDDYNFYDAHSPTNDNGTISPTAALSSFPYTPFESYQAMRYMYLKKGAILFGKYGFYDAYNAEKNWYSNQYLAIDQGPIVVMIENYRSGLLWSLGEKTKELQIGLQKMGIHKPNYPTGFYMYIPDPKTNDVTLMTHPDSGDYVLDFAVAGNEPIELTLTDHNNNKQTLIPKTNSLKEMQKVHFKTKSGRYKATITQGNNQHEVSLILK
ncbi:glucoamylase family protein [Flectobacillus major]|uniref:glucoamylase family protein n=1 Tax=Flectobacillus major TaxID=103 RepID=UPI00040300D7|nr:glucoamylase family protein [Flectobacillus major]